MFLSQSPQGWRGKVHRAESLPLHPVSSGARQSQHTGEAEQVPLHPCGTGSSVGQCSSAVSTASCLLLTCVSTTVQTIYPVPWAMCSVVAKLLPVQLGIIAQRNTFCWGPQFPARTLKKSLSVFYKSCRHLSSSLSAPTRDPRQLLACPSSLSLFWWSSGPRAMFSICRTFWAHCLW